MAVDIGNYEEGHGDGKVVMSRAGTCVPLTLRVGGVSSGMFHGLRHGHSCFLCKKALGLTKGRWP